MTREKSSNRLTALLRTLSVIKGRINKLKIFLSAVTVKRLSTTEIGCHVETTVYVTIQGVRSLEKV